MKRLILPLLSIIIFMLNETAHAQLLGSDHKWKLNENGTDYFKLTLLNQTWLRYADYNDGSTYYGDKAEKGWDLGIRRFRVQMFAPLSNRIFLYSQFGMNNYNSISERKQGFFVHDAYGAYDWVPEKVQVGMGLSGWSGLARFSSPSVGTIMGQDAPIFQQYTNDAIDQFLRKLSVFMKGRLNRLDYRFIAVQPMATQRSTVVPTSISVQSNFAPNRPYCQYSGYLMWMFKDKESNEIPYSVGTYLGKKDVINVGAGFVLQKEAMWHLSEFQDTIYQSMKHFAVDVYFDHPMANDQLLHAYLSLVNTDYGNDYLRMNGPMNPLNGNYEANILNGPGTAFPMYGTGNTLYTQIGYKTRAIGKSPYEFMPYGSIQFSDYKGLNDAMLYFDIGLNLLNYGHSSKWTLAYQNRPEFDIEYNLVKRKSAMVLQYQVMFN